jgi:hypothetical protein
VEHGPQPESRGAELFGSGRYGGFGDAVDPAELLLEVADVGAGVHRTADDPLEGLLRRELAAVAVQVLAEPLAQLAELAALDLVVEIWDRLAYALPDLRRDDVAE